MVALFIQLATTISEVYMKSGGPEAVNRWLNDKLKEIRAINVALSGPDEPFPKE